MNISMAVRKAPSRAVVLGCIAAAMILAPVGAFATHDFLIGSHLDGAGNDHSPHVSFADPTDLTVVVQVDYFIHDHGGADALTAAQIARIQDGAAIWNNSGANVNLVQVASDLIGEIHVHQLAVTACGAGPIGCAFFNAFNAHDTDVYGDGHQSHLMAGDVIVGGISRLGMQTRGDWYTGVAGGGIGAAQLSYESVVVQEFGHLLGLGHNGNASAGHPAAEEAASPMNGLLPFATERLTLQASDLTAITHLYGTIPEPATVSLLLMGLVGAAIRARRMKV